LASVSGWAIFVTHTARSLRISLTEPILSLHHGLARTAFRTIGTGTQTNPKGATVLRTCPTKLTLSCLGAILETHGTCVSPQTNQPIAASIERVT
jgi:hypothetical protein